jgi:prepilin peptidase CpaA
MTALSVLIDCIGGVLIAAAISDVISLRIPNFMAVALVAFFAVYVIAAAVPLNVVIWHVMSGALVLAVGMGLFAFGLFGGGDVKLLAAVALLVGWSSLILLLFVVSLVGGILAVVIAALRLRQSRHCLSAMGLRSAIFEGERAYVPYAVAIAAGWFIVGPLQLV